MSKQKGPTFYPEKPSLLFSANHVKCFIHSTQKTLKVYEEFMNRLRKDTAELQSVSSVHESDFILAFCVVVPNQETSIRDVLQSLQSIPENKPVVLVVLHHTFDSEHFVTDSKRYVNEKVTVTVDCLFHEDKLLDCPRNNQSQEKITNFIKQLRDREIVTVKSYYKHDRNVSYDTGVKSMKIKTRPPSVCANKISKCLVFPMGETQHVHEMFIEQMKQKRKVGLEKTSLVEDCDFLLSFYTVVTRNETQIDAVLKMLQEFSAGKPTALVVLHHTNNPDFHVPDRSEAEKDLNITIVDCLFKEKTLLTCKRNEEALAKIIKFTNSQEQQNQAEDFQIPNASNTDESDKHSVKPVKYYRFQTADTVNVKEIFDDIERQIPNLQQVFKEDECDYIMAFCPVDSRHEIDIVSALQKINQISDTKPAALLLLHTFNPEQVVPDSSRVVNRGNLITVDCLFDETTGFLQCHKNNEALTKIKEYIKTVQKLQQPAVKPVKFYSFETVDKLNVEGILDNIKRQIPNLQRVFKVDECDYIICLCPVVSRAGTAITSALQKLHQISGSKPAALVVLHHTFNPEQVVPDSSRAVSRENLIAVDCLLNKNHGLLHCQSNNEALTKIYEHITPVEKRQSLADEKEKKDVPTESCNSQEFPIVTGTRNKHKTAS